MKNVSKIVAVAALVAAAQVSSATIITLGVNGEGAPTAVPTITVAPGGSFSLALWIQGQGPGYVQNVGVSVYQGTAATWAGGQITATNPFPVANAITGVSSTYASNIANIFSQTRLNTQYNVAGPAGYAGTVPFSLIGGINLTRPSEAITTASSVQVATLTGIAGATPGTYYLYLGRGANLTGVNESPTFRTSGSFIGALGTGASVTSTTQFGFGDLQVATSGAGANGSGQNTLSSAADAIINIVQPAATNPAVRLTPGGENPATVPGNGTGYLPTLANAGVFAFAGNNTGATIVAFDLDGIDGVPADLELPVGASLVPLAGLFADNLGGSFDFVVNFGNLGNGPFTASLENPPQGVSVNRIAAIPEPAALGLLAPVALMAARRRKA